MYSEMAYFDGNHCQHVATRDEHLRLERKRNEMRVAARNIERRRVAR